MSRGQLVSREDLVDLIKIANPNMLYGTARAGDIGGGAGFCLPIWKPLKM